jgi:hypothetical protein
VLAPSWHLPHGDIHGTRRHADSGVCVRVCSAGGVEPPDDELVDAEFLLIRLIGQASVQRFTDSWVELAGVGALRQGVGDGLTLGGHVLDDLGDEGLEPGEGVDLGVDAGPARERAR